MIVYEDTNPEQVRVFDRGVEIIEPKSFGEFQLSYRTGDVLTPRLAPNEPLRVELEDFADGHPRRAPSRARTCTSGATSCRWSRPPSSR